MTTKLYLHDAANVQSGTFPNNFDAALGGVTSWAVTGAATLRTMNTTIGTAQTSRTGTSLASTSLQNGDLGFWVSPALSGAQTVGGGTVTVNHANSESNTNMNLDTDVRVWIEVWRPGSGASVGVVASGPTLTGPLEPTAASSEQVSHGTTTSSGISAADGDVIVVRVQQIHTQAMATAYTGTVFYDGTTENTTENSVVSNHAAFIQFAETLAFKGGPVSNPVTVTVGCTSAVAFGAMTVGKVIAVAAHPVMAFGAKTISKTLAVAAHPAAALVKQVTKTVAAACASSVAVTVSRAFMVTVTVACAGAVAITKAITRVQTVTVACAAAAAVVKSVGKTVAVAAHPAVALVKQVTKTLTVASSSAVAAIKSVGKVVAVAAHPAVVVTVSRAFLVTVTVACAAAVAVTKAATRLKTVTVACASSVAVVKSVGKIIAVAAHPAVVVSVSRAFLVTIAVTCTTAVSVVATFIAAAGGAVTDFPWQLAVFRRRRGR